jgi:hypothetical protein
MLPGGAARLQEGTASQNKTATIARRNDRTFHLEIGLFPVRDPLVSGTNDRGWKYSCNSDNR